MTHQKSTKIVERSCQCGMMIFTAIDEGMPVKVDPTPLSQAEEVAALIDGRWTFARLRCGELVHRHDGRIRHGLIGESIHAQHRCPPTYSQPSLIGAR